MAWVNFETLFKGHVTITDHFSSIQSSIVGEISNLNDRYCESHDEEYVARGLLKRYAADFQPRLIWPDLRRIDELSSVETVRIRYGIPVNFGEHGSVCLYFGLPPAFKDQRSDFVVFGLTAGELEKELVVDYRIPRDSWEERGIEWFHSTRDRDFEWLECVFETYREAETAYNERLPELIYRHVKKRYDFVRNLSSNLNSLPPPRVIGEFQPDRTRKIDDPRARVHKRILFGQQEGACKGCGEEFRFGDMTTDHILPISKGGANDFDNLQLLCLRCNSLKANGTMDELYAALIEQSANRESPGAENT